jgi:predicted ATPase
MNQYPLIDRQDILQKLVDAITQGWKGNGSINFIEGSTGMGKTILLKMLQEKIEHSPQFEKPVFAYGYAYENIGSQNAYQPFIDILETLTKHGAKSKNVGKLTLNILKETAPDWLQLAPIIGPALGASIKTVTVANQWLLDNREDTKQSKSLANQYINALAKLVAQRNHLILIIEDAHWIDDASCQLLSRLASKIKDQPITLFITYRPDYLDDSHPLKRVQRDIFIKGSAQIISLAGLTETQVQNYIVKRFKTPLHTKLAGWLEHLCKGNPLFVTQYLSLLEQNGVIRQVNNAYILDGDIQDTSLVWKVSGALADTAIPLSLEAVLEQRVDRLLAEDREMLQLGAVQGDAFMSIILAELTEKKERDILFRLRQIVEKHRVISFSIGEEFFKKRSEYYIFEHHLMQQAFYTKLSPRERIIHHHSVAEFLERLIQELKNPPRKMLLEIAYHYHNGNEPVVAARYYLLAARSSFFDGAFIEAISLCKESLGALDQIEGQDRMLVEVIQLLLIASEMRWRGKPDLQGDPLQRQTFFTRVPINRAIVTAWESVLP